MQTSSAIRVSGILITASHNSESGPVQHALAKILKLATPADHESQDIVSTTLTELRQEIRRVETQLKEKGVPQELIDLPINAALNLTSPLHLATQWQQQRQSQLRPDVLVAWKWIAFLLPSTEDEVTEEALRDLELDLDQLNESANAEGVPEDLRVFINRQADKIRNALRRYQVEGVEPLREVISTGMGDLIRAAPTIAAVTSTQPAAVGAIGRLKKTWTSVAKVAGDLNTLSNAYHSLANTVPALKHFAEESWKSLT